MVRKLVIQTPPLGLYLNFYFFGYTEYTEYTVNDGGGVGGRACTLFFAGVHRVHKPASLSLLCHHVITGILLQ